MAAGKTATAKTQESGAETMGAAPSRRPLGWSLTPAAVQRGTGPIAVTAGVLATGFVTALAIAGRHNYPPSPQRRPTVAGGSPSCPPTPPGEPGATQTAGRAEPSL